MDPVKYKPDELERMIDEEIALIDAANSAAAAEAMRRLQNEPRSPLRRMLDFLRDHCLHTKHP